MNIYRTTRLVILFLLWPFHAVVAQSDLPDPREILLKAQQALLEIQSLSYQAEYYNIGLLEFRGEPLISSPIEGDVMISRTLADDPIGIKLFIDWKLVKTMGDRQSRAFTAAYDGQKIRKLDPGKEIVYVNDPDQTGMMLLVGGYELIPNVIRSVEPFQEELSMDNLRYDGAAVVGGVPCHIVHIPIHETDGYENEVWWFLGVDDYLPRKKHEVYIISSGDRRMVVLTLTDLKINEAVDPSRFVLSAPDNYTVKVYEIFGTPTSRLKVGDVAPNWTLAGVDGKNLSLRNLRGQVVVMDFWATWCGPCLVAMPEVQKLHEQYGKQGVVVLGISTWESGDPVALMKEKGYTYPLLLNGDEVAETYGINGIPTTFVIGRDGKILYGQVGNIPDEYAKWNEVIVDALAEE